LPPCISATLVAGLWLAAPPSEAGTMVVYSCRTPSGRTVPTDGWTLSTDNAVLTAGVGNSCVEGAAGVLKLAVQREGTKVDGSQEVSWTFRAAESTTVSEFKAWVCGSGLSAQGFARVWWQPRTEFDPAIIVYENADGKPDTMGCQGPGRWWADSRNMVQGSAFSTPYVTATAGCAGICGFETDYLYEFASPQPCPTALADATLTMDNTSSEPEATTSECPSRTPRAIGPSSGRRRPTTWPRPLRQCS
jgi:hypothetical protein